MRNYKRTMIITSPYLYDFSEQNNREIEILVTKEEDEHVFIEAAREVKRCFLSIRIAFHRVDYAYK